VGGLGDGTGVAGGECGAMDPAGGWRRALRARQVVAVGNAAVREVTARWRHLESRTQTGFRIMNSRLILGAGTAGLALWLAAAAPRAGENVSLSTASSPAKRAKWQERLTLGPGDVLNFSLLDAPELARAEVVIGPDGRVTYLQARDVVAAGLTIDELRAKFDTELAKYYRAPRTIITPAAYRSKKYFVLGAVANKGVYSLDRPTTIIEAIARAGGLETGLFERNTVELADLQRSFLVRNGQRMSVDFERLFQRGDLSQNIRLEPDDYLYFASANANEIYVAGEVTSPGVLAFAPKATVISAITSRGGFSGKAFKSRVLVVRGSLDHPETFVVDTAAILSAKTPDFKLQPKDIVYVSSNPWATAADILDAAARAFMQAFIVQATSTQVGPLITHPLVK
jgi:protein involved in polysaccharide export with SLBB domain